MVVKKSLFGTGWVLNGGHEDILCGPVEFAGNVQVIRSGFYRSNKIAVTYSQEVKFNTVEDSPVKYTIIYIIYYMALKDILFIIYYMRLVSQGEK